MSDSPNDFKLLSPAEAGPIPEAESAPHLAAEDEWRTVDPEAIAPRITDTQLTQEELTWPHAWHTLCWHLASGLNQRESALAMGYTESRISIILSNPAVRDKVERIRREYYGDNLSKKVGRLVPKSIDYFDQVISGGESAASVGNRLQAAQWVLEKHGGKPKQEIENTGGFGIGNLIDALDSMKMKAKAEAEAQTIDVTPAPPPVRDPMKDWVEANVPHPKNEKSE